jgi:hypothetical protein
VDDGDGRLLGADGPLRAGIGGLSGRVGGLPVGLAVDGLRLGCCLRLGRGCRRCCRGCGRCRSFGGAVAVGLDLLLPALDLVAHVGRLVDANGFGEVVAIHVVGLPVFGALLPARRAIPLSSRRVGVTGQRRDHEISPSLGLPVASS